MPFECPDCAAPGALHITLTLALPPDSRSDEIALQIVRCQACDFRGLAVYEESRRGALDSEAWEHQGYRVAERDWRALAEFMQRCPQPADPRCPCPAHRALGKQDAGGRWQGLATVTPQGTFPMRLSS